MSESTFVRVCSVKDLPEGTAKGFQVNGVDVAVVHAAGKLYCIGDICTHEHEHLHEGWVEGNAIECPRHGAQFDLKTGEALSLPATEPVVAYDVKLEGDDVLIRLN